MTDLLFNTQPDKLVYAFDLFDRKHKRSLKNFRFRVSTYGILFNQNKLLVQRHPKLTTFGLPGGGGEIGEKLNDSLFREFEEETGLKIAISKLFSVTEDFFTYKGQDAHSIL